MSILTPNKVYSLLLCCVMYYDQYASLYTGRGVSGWVCSEEWKKFDCSGSGVQTQQD